MRSTWNPTSRAATGLLPTAIRRKPKAVFRRMISAAMATRMKSMVMNETPPMPPWPKTSKNPGESGMPVTGEPPATTSVKAR